MIPQAGDGLWAFVGKLTRRYNLPSNTRKVQKGSFDSSINTEYLKLYTSNIQKAAEAKNAFMPLYNHEPSRPS